jgi:chromosome partitioning protein
MANIICIASQKGGTGKTTTAVNLSASLALFEKNTLLVDCDPAGNATTNLGIDKKSLSFDLYHALAGEIKPQDVILPSDLPFLSIIPTRFGLSRSEKKLSLSLHKKNALRNLLDNYRKLYEYIIIDSSSMGFLTIAALSSADWLLIPSQLQINSLEGLGQLLKVVHDIREKINNNLKIAGILLTMYEETKSALPYGCLSGIKDKLFSAIIPWDRNLRDSANYAKPLALYDIQSRGAKAHLDLAKELIEVLKIGKKPAEKNIYCNN